MKKKVIFDCDNTMGIIGKDVDDGLTLLYLLGRDDIELLGLTLTYGNSSLDDVKKATYSLLDQLNIKDLKVFSDKEAAIFLAEQSEKYKDELIVLATGSMTNLHSAYNYNNNFYKNLKEIYLMGGIIKPLVINNVEVKELNFACNPEAAYNVLTSPCKISILNGHTTANAIFGLNELETLYKKEGEIYRVIEKSIEHWVDRIYKKFNIEGFCNWDMAAAIYISHKELFSNEEVSINPTIESLKSGDLNLDINGSKKIIMPETIKDLDKFNSIIFQAFENFNKRCNHS